MRPFIKDIGEVQSSYNSLGWYVYHLRIEGDDIPFYVGKGISYRVNTHFTPSSLNELSYKNNKIKKAQREGKKIIREIIKSDLTDVESIALEIEEIKKYGRKDIGTGCLTNHTDGGDGTSGYKHTSEEIRKMILAANRPEMILLKKYLTGKQFDVPGSREYHSELTKNMWKDNDWRNRQVNSRLGKKQDPVHVAARAISIKLMYQTNPELIEIRRAAAIKNGLGKGKRTESQILSAKENFKSSNSEESRLLKSNKMSQKVWINDGQINRRVSPSEILEGWVKGRLKKG